MSLNKPCLALPLVSLWLSCASPTPHPKTDPGPTALDAAAHDTSPKPHDLRPAPPPDLPPSQPLDSLLPMTVPDASVDVRSSGDTSTASELGLPLGWRAGDVGKVPTPGKTTYKDGQFAVEGSGYELWHHIDFFHTVQHDAQGDAALVAKLTSVEKVTNGSAAGLIVRFDPKGDRGSSFPDSNYDPHLHPDARSKADFQKYIDDVLGKQPLSPGAMIFWANGNVIYAHRWQLLGPVGGWGPGPTLTQVAGVPLPVWLKIERTGTKFTASYATDGVTWKTIPGNEPSYTEEVFKRQGDPNSVKPTDPYSLGMFYLPKLAGTKTGKATFDSVTFTGGGQAP